MRYLASLSLVLLAACSPGTVEAAAPTTPAPSPTPTVAASTPSARPTTPGPLALGRTATTPAYKVTAYTVSTTKAAKAPGAEAGNVWVSVDAKFCLSAQGPADGVTLSWAPWSIVGQDGAATFPASTATYQGFPVPQYPFASDKVLMPGSCSRGWVLFEVPKGTKVAEVLYQPSSGESVRWA